VRGRGALQIAVLQRIAPRCDATVCVRAARRGRRARRHERRRRDGGAAVAPVLYATTFADAADRSVPAVMPEAYGRFGRARRRGRRRRGAHRLVLHRYGPALFGSQWDASGEQLAAWTAWSEAAARRDPRDPGGRPQP
jgi:hypothetical protein